MSVCSQHDRRVEKLKILLLVKMKEKKLLKIRSLPKVLRAQAMRSTWHYVTYWSEKRPTFPPKIDGKVRESGFGRDLASKLTAVVRSIRKLADQGKVLKIDEQNKYGVVCTPKHVQCVTLVCMQCVQHV